MHFISIVRGYLDSFWHSTIMIGFALLSILVGLFSLVRWASATHKECLTAVRLHWSRLGQRLWGGATGHGKYEDKGCRASNGRCSSNDVSQNSSARSLPSHYSPYPHPFPPIPSPQHIPLCQHCRYSLNIHLKQQNWRVLTCRFHGAAKRNAHRHVHGRRPLYSTVTLHHGIL